MIQNPNKIMVRLSYTHTPPRCRKSRGDSFHIFADTKEEGRLKLYDKARDLIKKSKNVSFRGDITYQPARLEPEGSFSSKSYAMFPIPGRDDCTAEALDLEAIGV